METQKMDIPKISNSYIPNDNPISEIFEGNDKNGNGHSFRQNDQETATENQEDNRPVFFKSYTNDSETFEVSTNEWLGTWRPLT